MTDELKAIRDMLLKEVKEIKSEDYKMGYWDGILDLYNEALKIPEVKNENKTCNIVKNILPALLQ